MSDTLLEIDILGSTLRVNGEVVQETTILSAHWTSNLEAWLEPLSITHSSASRVVKS
ncbi:MAG: hypothetical protein HN416_12950 [Nitrospina sp.]|nr:hypothetical protein [Nitrospina sp.]